MDFSSPSRALISLERRHPVVSAETVETAKLLLNQETSTEEYLIGVGFLLQAECERWEGLTVGLLLATKMLVDETTAAAAPTTTSQIEKAVYIDGPRVPDETKDRTDSERKRTFADEQLSQVATWLHKASLKYLEHNEPRVRTFVAKAVGAHATWSVSIENEVHAQERNCVHSQVIQSIEDHIKDGRDNPEQYSKSSTGALDDTTGWRALETNWQCLACWIASLGSSYFQLEGLDLDLILSNLEYSAVTHVNRHVRAAAIAVLEQLTISAGEDEQHWHLLESGSLRKTNISVLKAGLADNWSQVRMAASVLNRVFWKTIKETCKFSNDNLQKIYPILIPRMCLNRFYLAQGVKLYSHQTWKLLFPDSGLEVVAQTMAPIVRYYVQMCDADNHVVREAACQAVAELAVKIGMDDLYASALQPHVTILLQALLMCFHDESWPVRDEACLACGTFCRAYPEECRPELETLWTRWTEQLTDQIWSVRADAAVALGQACQAYGDDFLQRLLKFIDENLPAAEKQPKMTMEEYKALQNDMAAHTDSQLYSCGSLAPKLKKKAGAGRIGCMSCAITREKQPWEATDGCVYLLRELVEGCSLSDSRLPPLSDDLLLPLFRKVADVCRVSHFPQSDDLRATLWRQLLPMMEAVGKQRCKRLYLEVFMDLLMRNIESRSVSALSKHAAATCAYELSVLVGPNIFRGRVYDDYQKEALDRALRERQIEEEKAAPMMQRPQGTQFSPFEPPGLLDNLDYKMQMDGKMTPGLPQGMLNQHPGASIPGISDTMDF
jgi:hypothetical protein